MFNFASKKILKIVCILLFCINFWLIYFEISTVNDLDKKVNTCLKSNKMTLHDDWLLEKELNLDKELDVLDLAEHETNIALNYYNEWKSYSNSNDWKEKGIEVCDTELPIIKEIEFNNIFWQTIPNTKKTQYFLYNAYYDNRDVTKYVRVVGSQRHGVWSKLR